MNFEDGPKFYYEVMKVQKGMKLRKFPFTLQVSHGVQGNSHLTGQAAKPRSSEVYTELRQALEWNILVSSNGIECTKQDRTLPFLRLLLCFETDNQIKI